MNTKIIKRSLCWLITLLLVMSAMVIAVPAEAQAATGTIKVRIANAKLSLWMLPIWKMP